MADSRYNLPKKPIVYKRIILGDCSFGKGVFAVEPIAQNEIILEFGGEIISSDALPYPYASEKDYFLQIGDDIYLGPSGGIDDYVNHSCSPNSGIRIQHHSVELISIAPIKKGDQITFNYSTTMSSDWGQFPCSCGSRICLGVVKTFLELPPSIQKKYIELDIVPNYILEKLINI